MSPLRAHNHKNGYSLIELIVSVAIGMTLMIALSAAIIMQQRDQIAMKQNLEANEIESEVRLLLSNPDNCLTTLGGIGMKPPPNGPMSALKFGDGTIALASGTIFANLVELTSMQISTLYKPPTPDGRWQFQIMMKITPTTGSQQFQDRNVEMYVNTDKNGNMLSCGAIAFASFDCRTVVQNGFGVRTIASCNPPNTPQIGYHVVSCGMKDDNPSKNNDRVMRADPVANICECADGDSSGLDCVAICCRY